MLRARGTVAATVRRSLPSLAGGLGGPARALPFLPLRCSRLPAALARPFTSSSSPPSSGDVEGPAWLGNAEALRQQQREQAREAAFGHPPPGSRAAAAATGWRRRTTAGATLPQRLLARTRVRLREAAATGGEAGAEHELEPKEAPAVAGRPIAAAATGQAASAALNLEATTATPRESGEGVQQRRRDPRALPDVPDDGLDAWDDLGSVPVPRSLKGVCDAEALRPAAMRQLRMASAMVYEELMGEDAGRRDEALSEKQELLLQSPLPTEWWGARAGRRRTPRMYNELIRVQGAHGRLDLAMQTWAELHENAEQIGGGERKHCVFLTPRKALGGWGGLMRGGDDHASRRGGPVLDGGGVRGVRRARPRRAGTRGGDLPPDARRRRHGVGMAGAARGRGGGGGAGARRRRGGSRAAGAQLGQPSF
jgi:hypothetical protein